MVETVLEKRVDRLEQALMELAYQSRKTEIELDRLSKEMRDFKDEMKVFKNEMKVFKDEMNRQWGNLANRLGTITEDIVAPGIPSAIKRTFDLELEELSIRRRKRKKERSREYDVIAATKKHVFVVDVKSSYRPEFLEIFKESLEDFFSFFPEYEGKKLVGVISSFNLAEDVVNLATRYSYLALSMSGDYLTFLNDDKVKI